jgi:hypothetical protein
VPLKEQKPCSEAHFVHVPVAPVVLVVLPLVVVVPELVLVPVPYQQLFV